ISANLFLAGCATEPPQPLIEMNRPSQLLDANIMLSIIDAVQRIPGVSSYSLNSLSSQYNFSPSDSLRNSILHHEWVIEDSERTWVVLGCHYGDKYIRF